MTASKAVRKKAKKFVRKLADRLNNDGWKSKKKTKKFRKAITNLPDGELKSLLQSDLDTYLTLLLRRNEKCEESDDAVPELSHKQGQKKKKKRIDDGDCPPTKKAKLSCTEEKSVSCIYNLYLSGSKSFTEINPSAENFHDACRCCLGEKISNIRHKHLMKLLSKIDGDSGKGLWWIEETLLLCETLSGNNSSAGLKKVMTHLNSTLAEQADTFHDLKSKGWERVKDALQTALKFFHFKAQGLTEPFGEPKYLDLVAAILSVYFDIVAAITKSSKPDVAERMPRNLFTFSILLLQPELNFIYDVILQQSDSSGDDISLFMPIWRHALLKPCGVDKLSNYTKYICAYKRVAEWVSSMKQEAAEFRKVALSVSSPKSYFNWATSQSAEIFDDTPLTSSSPPSHITRFLVDEATPVLMEELLNLLTSEYIGDEVEETGTSKEVIRAAETSSTKTETTDNLFFIDTQANIDIEAHGLKVQDEPEVEVYDFSEADIEKELAKMDESSSEESDDNGSSSDESDEGIEKKKGKGRTLKKVRGKGKSADEESESGEQEEISESVTSSGEEIKEPKRNSFVDDEASEGEEEEEDEEAEEDEDEEEGEDEDEEEEEEEEEEEPPGLSLLDDEDEIAERTAKSKGNPFVYDGDDNEADEDDNVDNSFINDEGSSEEDEDDSSSEEDESTSQDQSDKDSKKSEEGKKDTEDENSSSPHVGRKPKMSTRSLPMIESDESEESDEKESPVIMAADSTIHKKPRRSIGARPVIESDGSQENENDDQGTPSIMTPDSTIHKKPRRSTDRSPAIERVGSDESNKDDEKEIESVGSDESNKDDENNDEKASPVTTRLGSLQKQESMASPSKRTRSNGTSENGDNRKRTLSNSSVEKLKDSKDGESPRTKLKNSPAKKQESETSKLKNSPAKKQESETSKLKDSPARKQSETNVDIRVSPKKRWLSRTDSVPDATKSPNGVEVQPAAEKSSPSKKKNLDQDEQTEKKTEPSPRQTRGKLRRQSGIKGSLIEPEISDSSSVGTTEKVDKTGPLSSPTNKSKSPTIKSKSPSQSLAPSSPAQTVAAGKTPRPTRVPALSKDVYDFTSDVETPVPLKQGGPKRGLNIIKSILPNKIQLAGITPNPLALTPKKTRASQLVEDEIPSLRRSRRLSVSSDTSNVNPSEAVVSSPRRRKSMGIASSPAASPAKASVSSRRRSVLPVQSEEISVSSPKKTPSTPRRRSMRLT